MTIQQLIAWVQAGQLLVNAGQATAEEIKAWIRARNPAMTEDQLNEIIAAVIADAKVGKALSDADIAAAGQ